MIDPVTDAEWREAVDEAEFYLHLDASVKYGLVDFTGQISVNRCEEILRRGRARGITPAPDAVERILREKLRKVERLNITGARPQ
jgi:O-succinylbenzoate synthase